MKMVYPSDVTDRRWQLMKEFIETGRRRKQSLRLVFNAVLSVVKAGSQRRMLPLNYPTWQVVYYYFNQWEA